MDRKLHIGGKIKTKCWEVLDVVPVPDVDHVMSAGF